MSQAKVDRYKEQKANRKQIMAKEKREKMLWRIGGCVVAAALVVWIGYSAFDRFYEAPRKFYEVDTTAISDYLTGLASEDAIDEVVDTVDEEFADDEGASEAAEDVTEAAEDATEAVQDETETAEASEEETEQETETVTEQETSEK